MDRLQQQSNSPPRPDYRSALWVTACMTVLCCSGCSLFVMAGKAILGDPKVSAPFTTATGKDLTEGDDAVVIICTAPHRILSRFPSLQIDILDRVSRNLENHNIRVVNSGDVASWYDDHGEWGDYSELAKEFDATYVVDINLRQFDHQVPESENLLRGTVEGHLSVHEVRSSKKLPSALKRRRDYLPVTMVFDRDFSLKYPTSYPVPREKSSEDRFIQGFVDRVAVHISQHLYDYRMSDSIH